LLIRRIEETNGSVRRVPVFVSSRRVLLPPRVSHRWGVGLDLAHLCLHPAVAPVAYPVATSTEEGSLQSYHCKTTKPHMLTHLPIQGWLKLERFFWGALHLSLLGVICNIPILLLIGVILDYVNVAISIVFSFIWLAIGWYLICPTSFLALYRAKRRPDLYQGFHFLFSSFSMC